MFVTALVLAAFALRVRGDTPKWEFYSFQGEHSMLSYGRLDPIVNPGQVATHVHQIQGGNAMSATYDYDTLRRDSSCSTIEVQDDLSNYWAPAMYHYDGVGNYSLMLSQFHIYYQFSTFSYDANNPAGSPDRYPFPEGLTMVAGNVNQRMINDSDPHSTASVFQCQRANGDSPYSHDMRDFQRSGSNCDSELRATTRFPSCWDGVADNTDLTHVVYPGRHSVCPESHPKALMSLLFEWYWPVQDFPFDSSREDNWVLSFGDTSGFGFHGDFANGWNVTLMEQAISECQQLEVGIEKCPPFQRYHKSQIPACMPTGLYPDENVGLDGHSLTALPGCNPLWTDNSTKPTCASERIVAPSLDRQLGPDLSSWNYVSCPFFNTPKGALLTAHSRTKWDDMTVDSCLAECKGYKYAAMEWGNECYCDNEIRGNGVIESDDVYSCHIHCPGAYLQQCGGLGSASLYEACEGNDCKFNSVFPGTTPTAASDQENNTGSTVTATATPSADAGVCNTAVLKTSQQRGLRCDVNVLPKNEAPLVVAPGTDHTAETCAALCYNTATCVAFALDVKDGDGEAKGACSLFSHTIADTGSEPASETSLYYNYHCFSCN